MHSSDLAVVLRRSFDPALRRSEHLTGVTPGPNGDFLLDAILGVAIHLLTELTEYRDALETEEGELPKIAPGPADLAIESWLLSDEVFEELLRAEPAAVRAQALKIKDAHPERLLALVQWGEKEGLDYERLTSLRDPINDIEGTLVLEMGTVEHAPGDTFSDEHGEYRVIGFGLDPGTIRAIRLGDPVIPVTDPTLDASAGSGVKTSYDGPNAA